MEGHVSDDDMGLLGDCFFFRNARPGTVARAAEMATVREYGAGEIVYSETEFERRLGVVLSGRVEVKKERFVMNVLEPGSVFGVAAVFNDEVEYVTTLTAAGNARILFISQRQLQNLMDMDFTVTENYIRFLTGRILFLNRKIDGLVMNGAAKSLMHWLLQNRVSEGSGSYADIKSFSRLAGMLHMSRSSLYRAMDELETEGCIHKDGRRIFITEKTERLKNNEEELL